MVEIISYHPAFHHDFKRLNMEWLERFGLLESHDLEILDDPEGTVIKSGGKIFLAKEGEKIVGSAGIMKANDNAYELVKMAVDPEYRGRGISMHGRISQDTAPCKKSRIKNEPKCQDKEKVGGT